MKRMHMLPCLLKVVAAVVVLVALGFDGVGISTAAVLLLCPLVMFGMMFFMMRGTHDGHGHGHDTTRDHHTAAR